MKLILTILIWLVTALCIAGAPTTPLKVMFQARVSSLQSGAPDGYFNTEVRIINGDDAQDEYWSDNFNNVPFRNGSFSLVLGSDEPLTASVFQKQNPKIVIMVRLKDGSRVSTPPQDLPSTPYAIQSYVAESVLNIDAKNITGSFTQPVNVSANLVVGKDLLFVDADKRRIGVNTESPDYPLDVNGILNAQEILLNGKDLESSFSWKKGTHKDAVKGSKEFVYFLGNVGVGTSTPKYALDVSGSINAKSLNIQGIPWVDKLKEFSSWRPSQGGNKSIYFDENITPGGGFVGIGTSLPRVKLDVIGGIRIGEHHGSTPYAGIMQYVTNENTGVGEFFGYNGDEWISLIGIQGKGVSGNLAVWSGDRSLASSNKLFWDKTNAFLGLGTNQPDARIHIRQSEGESSDLFRIESLTNSPILTVANNGYIGIQTLTPNYHLDIQGIVNAKNYYLNGVGLEFAMSTDTFWERENPLSSDTQVGYERIFYDDGFVGIGTAEPRNLLELASPTVDPAITFDVLGTDLYTIGIENKNPEAFVISKGGDLKQPVFVFKNDKVGVGLNNPKANLHVQGNAGVLIEGQLNGETSFSETGRGSKMIWVPAKAAFRAGYVNGLNWDLPNLGLYSVGLGQNSLASGTGSFVGGGKDNQARGNYATVPGGYKNVAAGDFSFAAGHQAKAMHAGSFVWSDYTPTLNVDDFTSAQPNQFLIRAYGGVGIGTSDTQSAALTIKQPRANDFVFLARGPTESDVISIAGNGGLGIGTTDPGTSRLAIMDGKMGIGTTNAQATLTIEHPEFDEQKNILVVKSNASDTAGLIVTSSGNVGIGFDESTDVFLSDEFSLFVKGAIKATEFKMVDPKDKNRTITLSPNPGSPWTDPSTSDTNSTSRTQGNVGIGTPSPNYLLELSNRTKDNVPPIIAFDDAGNDRFLLGILPVGADRHVFGIQPGPIADNGPLNNDVPFVVAEEGVGIGIGASIPLASLHVSGNMIAKRLVVGTENMVSPYLLNVDGAMNVKELYINQSKFNPGNTPWETAGTHIYYDKGKVGINTMSPQTALDVHGSISANTVILDAPMLLDGDLSAQHVILQNYSKFTDATKTLKIDGNGDGEYGKLYVEKGILTYQSPAGGIKQISSELTKTEGETGKLAFWSDTKQNALAESEIQYNMKDESLTLSGNLTVKRLLQYSLGGGAKDYFLDTSVSLGSSSAIIVSANIDHLGDTDPVQPFTAEHISLTIADNYGSELNQVELIGLDINLKTMENKKLLNLGKAIGVKVDMSQLDVKANETGQKYAAIFTGGNVGIGTTQPTTELEVAGTVSANNFTLTGGLTVPTLRITGGEENGNMFVAMGIKKGNETVPRIGIGISNPDTLDAELNVAGTISANSMVVKNSITTQQLNVGNNSFVIDESGKIGIGTSEPNGRLHIAERLEQEPSQPLLSEKVHITIDGASPGNVFYYDQDITNTQISMSSTSPSNKFSNATANGLIIDLSKLELGNNSSAYGMYVDVSGDSGTRYAAIFNGGKVGIGTSNPTSELSVEGDIKADNLIITGQLEAEQATFNYLTINKSVSINGTISVKTLQVSDQVTINKLTIETAVNADSAVFRHLQAETAKINGTLEAASLNILESLEAQSGIFTNGLAIGTTNIPSDGGLSVSGNVRIDNVNILTKLYSSDAEIDINDGMIYTSKLYSNKLGIGTKTPTSTVHIVDKLPGILNPSNVGSWGTVRVHSISGIDNTAAGLALIPDPDSNSATLGSGIVAIRNNTDSTKYASHLAFITDPNDLILDNDNVDIPKPKERMRITSEGFVGINTTEPLAQLDVVGDTRISGNLTVQKSIITSTITAPENLVLSPTVRVIMDAPVSYNQTVTYEKGLHFMPQATHTQSTDFGQLYVNTTDRDLYYLKPGASSTPINISGAYTGAPGAIPYFDAQGNFTSDAPLSWDSDSSILTLGGADQATLFKTKVSVAQDTFELNRPISIHKIEVGIGDRSERQAVASVLHKLIGLDININSLDGSSINPGRLAPNETAVGLAVDVTDLVARQYVGTQSTTKLGYKYAASFTGGSVGIGTATPEATLHVRSENDLLNPLQIDLETTKNVLVVNKNGFVGIGTKTPAAQVHIQTMGTQDALTIFNTPSSGALPTELLIIKNDGDLGIGVADPSAPLEVNGTIKGTQGIFEDVIVATLNVGNNAFVVKNNKIGLGTTEPEGYLSIVTTNLSKDIQNYVAQKTTITLDNPISNSLAYFKHPIYGLDINVKTISNGVMQATMNGIHVDLSGVNIHRSVGANVYGAYIDTGSGANRYAGVFMGGNVGIGTSRPTEKLEVAGTVSANNLYISNALQMDNVTINNQLIVQGKAKFNDAVTVNRLVADIVSANSINFSGQITVSTANITTLNAEIASANRLKIGTAAYEGVLAVGGAAFIDGSVSINQILQVPSIKSTSTLSLSATNGLTITASNTIMNSSVTLKDGALKFADKAQAPDQSVEHGQLYMQSGDLTFLPKGAASTAINLTAPFIGVPGQVPVYDASGILSTTAYLSYLNDTFKVGASNQKTDMLVQSTVPDNTSSHSTVSINMLIGTQETGSSASKLTGLDILMGPDSTNTGRLAQGSTAIGLNVDVSGLPVDYFTPSGGSVKGTKIAAQFLGGYVGVGLTNPTALLHVKGENSVIPVLRLDGKDKPYALVVSANGNVGLGTSNPTALYHITGETGTPYMSFENSSAATVLTVLDDGKMGIGISPTEKLHVAGTVKATALNASENISAQTLTVGADNAFVIDAQGDIGFGIANPTSPLQLERTLSTSTSNPEKQLSIQTIIGDPTPGDGISQTFSQNITGLDVKVSSHTSDEFRGSGSNVATGVSINMKDLILDPDLPAATKRGIYVDLGTAQSNHYAAVFLGGNVGIGRTDPSQLLDVDGNIRATSMMLTGKLEAGMVTTNTLIVTGAVSVNASVTVNTLVAKNVSANNLTIKGTFTTTNGDFVTVTSNMGIVSSQLRINDASNAVSEDAKLSINGNAKIVGELNATSLRTGLIESSTAGAAISLNSNVSSDTSITAARLTARTRVAFDRVAKLESLTEQGSLFVDTNGDLKYMFPGLTTSVNISGSLTGMAGRIPFYGIDNAITDSDLFTWNTGSKTLQVGNPNSQTLANVSIKSYFKNASTAPNGYNALDIDTTLANANANAGSTITGISIKMDNVVGQTLGTKQIVKGLDVNVSGVSSVGNKYAAMFKGGKVGIGFTDPGEANADGMLVIKGDGTSDLIRTMSNDQNGFVVDKNGFVGLGVSQPSARLDILGGPNDIVNIKTSGGAGMFTILADGKVGIGKTDPGAALEIGTSSGEQFNVNNAFVITGNNVGIGVTEPTNKLEVKGDVVFKNAAGETGFNFVANDGFLGLGLGTVPPAAQLHVSGNVGIGSVLPVLTGGEQALTIAKSASEYLQIKSTSTEHSFKSVGQVNGFLFQTNPVSTLLTAMRIKDDKVGIGLANAPTSKLHVLGETLLGATADKYLKINTDGVGINAEPVTGVDLTVAGTISANTLVVDDSAVNTVNKLEAKTVKITRTFEPSDIAGSVLKVLENETTLTLAANSVQDVIGTRISLTADPITGGNRNASVFNGATAYGLYVDTSSLGSADSTGAWADGNLASAAFIGGNVGVGTTQPTAMLHVEKAVPPSQSTVDLLQVSNTNVSLTLRQRNAATNQHAGDSINNFDWVVKQGTAAYEAITLASNGSVGIGATDPDKSLVVGGDVRLGTYTAGTVGGANQGSKLLFSGATENGDELSIGRYNTAANSSELRVNFSTTTATNDYFKIGTGLSNSAFSPLLSVNAGGNVGIGAAAPTNKLHVSSATGGSEANNIEDYAALIENTAASNPNGLAINFTSTDGNFISFFSGSNSKVLTGAITNAGTAGIRFMTKGADYAEYLPKLNPNDTFEKGDIVGVVHGKISHDTQGADHILVRSSAASVAGNWPGSDQIDRYELIAFFGQVQTKVHGPVQKGDYVIPSGQQDGTAISVPKDAITIDQMATIIGEAWSDHQGDDVALINVAVGFNFSVPKLTQQLKSIGTLKSELDAVEVERKDMIQQYDRKLETQQKEIDQLIETLSKRGLSLN